MTTEFYSLKDFPEFDSAYWGLGIGANGKIYFGLCSHSPGKSAGLFTFDPVQEKIKHLFNLNDLLVTAHGKIHTPILEGPNNNLFFGTHFAYPFGDPKNEIPYEGGHLVCYDPKSNIATDLGKARTSEGILTVAINAEKSTIYMLTIPSGYLIKYDLKSKRFTEIGKIPSKGSICRTITIDNDGKVYGSFEDNGMFIYNPQNKKLSLHNQFFPDKNVQEWDSESRGGVNKVGRKLWRCASYDKDRDAIYGIYASDSRCFRIDCKTLSLKFFNTLVPKEFASAQNIYPTLSMASNGEKIFYVPTDGMFDYCRSDNMKKMSRLISFDKKSSTVDDLGLITDDGRSVFGVGGSLLVKNTLFLLGAVESKTRSAGSDPEDPLFHINKQLFELALIKVSV